MAQLVRAGEAVRQPRKLGDPLIDSFFQYMITFTFVANENQLGNIPIQSDAHFLVVSSYMNTNAATGAGTFQGAGVNRGGSLVLLTDGGTQRQLANVQIPADCLFGSAQRPYVWPFRHIFRANTSIGFSVTGTTGAGQTVDFVFGGFKIPLGSVPELGL